MMPSSSKRGCINHPDNFCYVCGEYIPPAHRVNLNSRISFIIYLFYLFYLYIYPPDSQESDGGAIHRVSNYPDLLPEMPRYCCPLII